MDNPTVLLTGKAMDLRTAHGGFTDQIHAPIKTSPSINDVWVNLDPRSLWRRSWNTFPENLVMSQPHSYPSNHCYLQDCRLGSLRTHSHQVREINSYWSWERILLPHCELSSSPGSGYLSAAPPILPLLPHFLWPSLKPTVWRINSSAPCRLFACTLVILSCSALWYLFTPTFCWLIGLCLIAAQTFAFLVAALFSQTLGLLPHST